MIKRMISSIGGVTDVALNRSAPGADREIGLLIPGGTMLTIVRAWYEKQRDGRIHYIARDDLGNSATC
jgi:hypothetical protein